MQILMTINLSMTMMLILLKHPLSMGAVLLIQTISVSMTTKMMTFMSIYSLILFLIMIGGMMILFIYMTSIASNEKFKSMMMNSSIIVILVLINMFMMNKFNVNLEMDKINFYYNSNMKLMFNKFWMYPMYKIMILMFIYLLITMIMAIKITIVNSGPLRQMN